MVHKMEWYVGTEWKLERKGLYKKVLALEFTKVEKPHQVAKVVINVEQVENLKDRETQWLNANTLNKDQIMEMGSAITPIDYYLEILVQQMMLGETAECTIKTKTPGEDVKIVLTLQEIKQTKGIQQLTVPEMYELASKYKENGVKMFKKYPIFAHEYFAKAAKCLISYKNFEGLTKKRDGVAGKDMQELFIQIQTNLAACLLNEKRYDDVLYQTSFVDTMNAPSEKSIYRRAMAYYHMHEYELAQKTIEKVADFKDKKEFANLYQKTKDSWKNSNAQYKGMVQKMFG
ncbi:peptidyl-prolyl cis-trans isomerase CPR6 [Lucilia sericata]|uniref:peptidyl-prolyl cis-trans isomerase CPR6 n=1 Tax=Lucilia sericata TaxID=13632 RepID=UPI0018A83F24|nr:peptidyl-prolyl cis-trans isomerase CPR6 [Lucilia sericata]